MNEREQREQTYSVIQKDSLGFTVLMTGKTYEQAIDFLQREACDYILNKPEVHLDFEKRILPSCTIQYLDSFNDLVMTNIELYIAYDNDYFE